MAQNAIDEQRPSTKRPRRANPFAAIGRFFGGIVLFIKQVMDELRKVVTPTRRELIRYTLVVLVFVVIMMALVTGLDQVFGRLVAWVFAGVSPIEDLG